MKYLMLIYGNQEKWASIRADQWPEAIARQDATVVLPSFGCVLVTKIDLPDPNGALNRMPLSSVP